MKNNTLTSAVCGPLLAFLCSMNHLSASVVDTLSYNSMSSVKVEQITGEVDHQLGGALTRNRTETLWSLKGTDLGFYCEHNNKGWFLFGDSMGAGGGDAIAKTTATDPETQGLPLDFLTRSTGEYYQLEPPGSSTGGWTVPVGCVSVGGQLYFVWRDDYIGDSSHPDYNTGIYKLYRFVPGTRTYHYIGEWAGRYEALGRCSFSVEDGNRLGIYDGDVVLVWGTKGVFRQSSAYFGWLPADDFETEATTNGIRYLSNLDNEGVPSFSTASSNATEMFNHPVIGDLSVAYVEDLDMYLMLYDSRLSVKGMVARCAFKPWGPWSDILHIYDKNREEGTGEFIHQAGVNDGLQGPVIGATPEEFLDEPDPRAAFELARGGGSYCPQLIKRFLKVSGGELDIYWTMSTWNPYQVVLMKSELPFTTTRLRFENKDQAKWLQCTDTNDGVVTGKNVRCVDQGSTGSWTGWELVKANKVGGVQYYRIENSEHNLWLKCNSASDETGYGNAISAVAKTNTGNATKWRLRNCGGESYFRVESVEYGLWLQCSAASDVDNGNGMGGVQVRAVETTNTGDKTKWRFVLP